jgi:acylglycerol lipase
MSSAAYANPHPDIGTELVRDWAPSGEPRAVVVLVHGVGEHSGRYERTGDLLARAGFRVRSFDLIGSGASGGRRSDIDKWSRYHDQVAVHVEWARAEGKPVILFGHSLGGNIALGYALSDRTRPDLLILSSPMMDAGTALQKAMARVLGGMLPIMRFRQGISGAAISRDPAVVEAYLSDPLVVTAPTLRWGKNALENIAYLNQHLQELDIPTLVIHGGDDRLVPTASSEVLTEVGCVERRVYDGLRHECMNEPEGPEVVADMVGWVDGKLG